MEYLAKAFICKLAAEVVFFSAKACLKRYKAMKKPDVSASDK